MNRFGLPLVPTALFLLDRRQLQRPVLPRPARGRLRGRALLGRRAHRVGDGAPADGVPAWPGPRSPTRSRTTPRRKRTYAFVLTYLTVVAAGSRSRSALLAPWLVELLARRGSTRSRRAVVGPLAFGAVAYAAYIVIAIGVGRARRTQFNWVVTGAAAAVNVALNLILIPPYGMMGAAIATVAAYVDDVRRDGVVRAARLSRCRTSGGASRRPPRSAVALRRARQGRRRRAPAGVALALVYPLALLVLGFSSRTSAGGSRGSSSGERLLEQEAVQADDQHGHDAAATPSSSGG